MSFQESSVSSVFYPLPESYSKDARVTMAPKLRVNCDELQFKSCFPPNFFCPLARWRVKYQHLRLGQMEMEPEGIVSFVQSATFGEVHKPADCRARNWTPIHVITRGNRVDIPVVAAVGSHRVTGYLRKCSFRFPIWTHVNPVLGSVAVKEVGDECALEGLVGRHGDHVVEDLRALVFDVRTHIIDGEWRIGYCSWCD